MPMRDIRAYKMEQRKRLRAFRQELTPDVQKAMDREILRRVMTLSQYKNCKTVLTYVSTAIEVDTRNLIERALKDGKRVAVPRCVPGTREMEFFFIRGLSDLEPGTFGVLEPVPGRCRKMTDFSEGLCIVPGLGFDCHGYRLGYGKGYYDRFLSRFGGVTAGICYSGCVRFKLLHGRFDRAVDILVTEKYIRAITGRGRAFYPVANRRKTAPPE
ncbi:MAG: 5-formyltetrahydrofolate cyclo-ligase [Clostridiales bacterium]|nr:5-formyltetrahydrofolate cyclo-ligase [Clostridiales bacterium]